MLTELRHGDAFEILATLEPESIDALVTDPPYGISFMGKHWDRPAIEKRVGARDVSHLGRLTGGKDDSGRKVIARTASAFATPASTAGAYDFTAKGNRAFQEWTRAWAELAFVALKPGAHVVVFGGTRTYHRMVSGLEDAGFEIRDQLAWLFGSGFPKSLDVSKAIDARLGEGQVAGRGEVVDRIALDMGGATGKAKNGLRGEWAEVEPVTDEARAWQGWGTALKPAHEPIVLARKPLAGTVAANVLANGTGALNIAACRVDVDDRARYERNHSGDRGHDGTRALDKRGDTDLRPGGGSAAEGRWPANVVLDEEAAAMLDEQTGELTSGRLLTHHKRGGKAPIGTFEIRDRTGEPCDFGGDSGGASRFFYVPKVDADERHAGLTVPSLFAQDGPERNAHPTVKPIELMRWLCRLVTPPGGTILDPFLGSGTTGIAAGLEGFSFVGIEREAEYMAVAQARIAHWLGAEVVVP